MFTSPVANFNNFGVVGVILVAMIGVGVAEEAGLIGSLIRLLVRSSPRGLITFIIVLIGILSSVATDAGYLVLIPLAAAAFLSMGRHPLAGLAAGFAGVGAAFGVNILIAPDRRDHRPRSRTSRSRSSTRRGPSTSPRTGSSRSSRRSSSRS